MRRLALAVAPELVFEFRDVEAKLLGAIAGFLEYYPAARDRSDALVITDEPPPLNPGDPAPETLLVDAENVAVRRSGSVTLFELPGASAWCDSGTARAGIAAVDPSERTCELFVWRVLAGLLIELAETRGWLGLHAAAAVVEDRGLLLTGPSGCGKSTLVANLHGTGCGVLSDDLVWLRQGRDGFEAFPFPRGTARPAPPRPTVERAMLDAIVRPEIVDRNASRITDLPKADVLDVLVEESGFLGAAAATSRRFRALVRLADALPGFRLEAGRHQEEVPPLLAGLTASFARAR